jgi:hypothetical protein
MTIAAIANRMEVIMERNKSRRLKSWRFRLSRRVRHLKRNLFKDRRLLKEDTRRTGVALMTASLLAAALDQGKYFDHYTWLAGLALLLIGLVLWLVGHYDN